MDCTDVMYSAESGEDMRRVLSPSELMLHSAYHNVSGRRQAGPGSGGFCEVNTAINNYETKILALKTHNFASET